MQLKEEKQQQQQYLQFYFLQFIKEIQYAHMGEILIQRCIFIMQQLL